MGFVQSIQKDLAQALAQQQQAVLLQVLRGRAGTLTFDELGQLLRSSVGKGIGAVRVAEIFGGTAVAPEAATSPKVPAGPRGSKTRRRKAKKQSKRGPRSKTATAVNQTDATPDAPRAQSKRGPRSKPAAAQPSAAPTPAPARVSRVSASKAAEIAQRTESVLEFLRRAGGWAFSHDIHAAVSGSRDQVRYVLNKLAAAGQAERRGQNDTTEYRLLTK